MKSSLGAVFWSAFGNGFGMAGLFVRLRRPGAPTRLFAPNDVAPPKLPEGRIIADPLTGWPVLDFGPNAPELTNEQVLDMLAEFP